MSRLARKDIWLPFSVNRAATRPRQRPPSEPEADLANEPLPLATKLVALAREQLSALDRGANEQYEWICLRRNEVTERLSRLVAASIEVSPDDAAAIAALREELLKVDAELMDRLTAARSDAALRQRRFLKTRKAIGSYLTLGAPRAVFDKRQ